MPSRSPAQARLMAAAAHSPAFAAKAGVPVSVAQEFNQADKKRRVALDSLQRVYGPPGPPRLSV
jgi:hypothetical protein